MERSCSRRIARVTAQWCKVSTTRTQPARSLLLEYILFRGIACAAASFFVSFRKGFRTRAILPGNETIMPDGKNADAASGIALRDAIFIELLSEGNWMKMHQTKNDLQSKTKTVEIELLNGRLADVIDLALLTKQAHWNLKGPRFIAIHEMLDPESPGGPVIGCPTARTKSLIPNGGSSNPSCRPRESGDPALGPLSRE